MKRQKGAAYGCYTDFSIYGNFDPDVVTEKIELEPYQSKKLRKGYAFSIATNESEWHFGKHEAYDKDNTDGFLIESSLMETIKPLLNKTDILNQIRNENDVRFSLYVSICIWDDWPMPFLSLPLEVIDFCTTTRTEIHLGVSVNGKILKLPSILSP